ncbi:MAG: tRNA pseudouridine(55) synthase TruB, partial [Ruminiclostridium sp.]|nr:tRNA pseudouridine(55) synthase TruB [Ruminiclostridium sp.]
MSELNGVICVNKPQDFTSFDVVAIMRRAAGTRKIGHGGTLDPMATGVLPIYIGRAAKTADLNPVGDKSYRAMFRLGVTTDTQDVWGKTLSENGTAVPLGDITAAVKTMQGDIMQVPPM